MADTNIIQKLRQATRAGVMDIKKALDEANNNEDQALEILKKRGAEIAAKKQAERTAGEGIIDAYVHTNGKVASLVLLSCETDFVAKNEEFKTLAHDLAMQVAAMNPENIEALLEQNFIKDESETIKDLINKTTAKLGEKIEVKEITRLEVA